MRKLCRASTSEDCKRLLQYSTTVPTASNSKISSISRTSDVNHSCGIDASKLLAATNSEEALKILNDAASANATFSICSEATKLMSTLQMSAIPGTGVDVSFRDFCNQPHPSYGFMHSTCCPQSFDIPDTKGSTGRFSTR